MSNYKGRTVGAVATFDNTLVRQYLQPLALDIYNKDSFTEFVPNWLDDVLAGASNQMSGTRPPSSYKVFMLLKSLDYLSTKHVGLLINKKQLSVNGVGYSKRYIEKWVVCLKTASQAIKYHKDFHEAYISIKQVFEPVAPSNVEYVEVSKEEWLQSINCERVPREDLDGKYMMVGGRRIDLPLEHYTVI